MYSQTVRRPWPNYFVKGTVMMMLMTMMIAYSNHSS